MAEYDAWTSAMDDYYKDIVTDREKAQVANDVSAFTGIDTAELYPEQPGMVKNPEPQESVFDSFVSTVSSGMDDIAGGLGESLEQAAGGIGDAITNASDMLVDMGLPDWKIQLMKDGKFDLDLLDDEDLERMRRQGEKVPEDFGELPEAPEAKTVTGNLIRGTTQFLTGFIPAMKGISGVRALAGLGSAAGKAAIAEAAAGGAISDLVMQDPDEELLSAYLNQVPGLQAVVPDYLATKEKGEEHHFENRIKNVIEGMGLGLAFDGMMKVFKGYKAARGMDESMVPPKPAAKTAMKTAAEPAAKAPEGKAPEAPTPSDPSTPMGKFESQAKIDELKESFKPQIPESQLRSLGDMAEDAPLFEKRQVTAEKRIEEALTRTPESPDLPTEVPTEEKMFINMARINSEDDVKELLQNVVDSDAAAIDVARGGKKKSLKAMEAEGDQAFKDLGDILGREPGPMSAAEAVAARKVQVGMAEQLKELAARASDPLASPADLFAFRKAMATTKAFNAQIIAARTETARALKSWHIPVGSDAQRAEAISSMLEQGGDSRKMAQAILDIGDNPAGLAKVVDELSKPTMGKAIREVWINGILSGPKTQMVNALSNAAVAMWSVPEAFMSATISKMFYGGDITFREATSKAMGLVQGTFDGIKLIAHGNKRSNLKGLETQFEQFVQMEGMRSTNITPELLGVDSNSWAGRGMDYMSKFINLPGTLLETSDKFFKAVSYRMELNAQATRTAMSEGLTGKEFGERVADIISNPPTSLKETAVDAAHYQTFTNPLGESGKAIANMVNKLPMANMVAPFLRTPMNVMSYTFARTPLAFLSSSFKDAIKRGGPEAASAYARMGLGTSVLMSGMSLVKSGVMTGQGPENQAVLASWRREGKQPYSIKIGDQWYNYSRIEPIGTLLGFGASMAEMLADVEDGDADFAIAGMTMKLAQGFASKGYLSGIMDFMGALDPRNPMSSPEKFIGRLAISLAVPYSSLLRTMRQGYDQHLRITDDEEGYFQQQMNEIKNSLPGFSKHLPLRRDLWGNPIKLASAYGAGYDMLSPIASRTESKDPVDLAMIENKTQVGQVSKKIEGVKLTPEQYSRYQELAGKGAKEYLDKLVRSEGFKRMSDGPDGMKSNMIQNIVRKYRRIAKAQMMQEDFDLYNAVLAKKQERASKLRGVDVDESFGNPIVQNAADGQGADLQKMLGGF